ncbi:MAG: hypothetical protein EZS28_004041 [Streblomastix strix]|uniref:Protein kinase domain-containing protein n=1 Tax=Streblomastix strix TaxID=222440 RepID=A0A5J4X0Z3_9EUKA|nr:MAG: hypothetical protein EZS28_004041 [Streblomastix strix]
MTFQKDLKDKTINETMHSPEQNENDYEFIRNSNPEHNESEYTFFARQKSTGNQVLVHDIRLVPGISISAAKSKLVIEHKQLAKLGPKNFVQFYGIFEKNGHICLALEAVEGQTIYQFINKMKERKKLLSTHEFWYYTGRIATLLYIIQKVNMIHGHLSSSNIFITKENKIKIDGLLQHTILKICGDAEKMKRNIQYLCPEQIEGKGEFELLTQQSDMYSLGIVLYQLVEGGSFPFEGKTEEELLKSYEEANCQKHN